MDKATRKYLAHYAEPSIQWASTLKGNYQHVLVIPCFAEGETLMTLLESLIATQAHQVLVICVLNAPRDASSVHQRKNHTTVDALHAAYRARSTLGKPPHWTEFELPTGSLLLLEHWQPPWSLPPKAGVGLARKLGCDLAVALNVQGTLHASWIHCTDADAQLPTDYFSRLKKMPSDIAAVCYPFTHDSEAALRYEASLRYFVLGLAHAGSPYAHHTVGSTFALSMAHYTQVRGFPKRQAAEDYYLLNKLAKVGRILRLKGAPLILSGRASDRVPFGTGPAVRRLENRPNEPNVYHPTIFDKLREHLARLGSHPKAHIHFDAFQTLKWIHALRDSMHPSIGFRQACSEAHFVHTNSMADTCDVQQLCHALQEQENQLSPLTGLSHGPT